MLDQIVRVFLWLHIAAGFTGFFVAPVALITRKGGGTHRRWGKVYFWAMTVAALSAMVIAAYRPNLFLLLVGIFAFYLAFSDIVRSRASGRSTGRRRRLWIGASRPSRCLLLSR